MQNLSSLLSHLQSQIPNHQKQNASISQSNVGWHIEHSLMVIINITEVLKKSDPANYKWKFSLARSYVYTFNKIPRGRGKAPKSVQPKDDITVETLNSNLAKAELKIQELKKLHPKSNFVHPYFGMLNLKQTIKFLNLHTEHHLKIINDIVISDNR